MSNGTIIVICVFLVAIIFLLLVMAKLVQNIEILKARPQETVYLAAEYAQEPQVSELSFADWKDLEAIQAQLLEDQKAIYKSSVESFNYMANEYTLRAKNQAKKSVDRAKAVYDSWLASNPRPAR